MPLQHWYLRFIRSTSHQQRGQNLLLLLSEGAAFSQAGQAACGCAQLGGAVGAYDNGLGVAEHSGAVQNNVTMREWAIEYADGRRGLTWSGSPGIGRP